MIKLRHKEQSEALRVVLVKAADCIRVDISQYNNGMIGVTQLNDTGKVTVHTYIAQDGRATTAGEGDKDATQE
jgi:hypothetical protein